MKTRLALHLAAATLGLGLAARPAGATTNLYTPVAGAQFQPVYYPAEEPECGTIQYSNGSVMNTPPDQSQSCSFDYARVWASLGKGTGTVNFKVFGRNNGGQFSCTVVARDINGGTSYSYNGVSWANGAFNFNIPATPPTGNYAYQILCDLPPPNGQNATLYGVGPDR